VAKVQPDDDKKSVSSMHNQVNAAYDDMMDGTVPQSTKDGDHMWPDDTQKDFSETKRFIDRGSSRGTQGCKPEAGWK
jgi:hypothetical protein